MDLQTIFTGAFVLTLFVSAVLTTLFSFFLLWLYRRAVVRGMNLAAGVTGVAPPDGALLPPSYPLRITKMGRGFKANAAQDSSRIDRAMTLSLRRVALAYTAAGLVFAMFFAAADQVEKFGNIRPIPFFVSTIAFAWPIVLALSLLVALGSRDRLRFVLFYLAVFVVVGIFATSVILHQNPLSLVLFWLLSNGLATLLLLAFLTRRIRAVGPLVLVFMIAGVAGAVLLALAVGSSSYSTQRGLVGAFEAVGLGGLAAFYAIFLFGFAALAILGWGLLRLIGRRYRQKRMSDQSLTLDAMWLLFAMVNAINLASGSWIWILSGLVAFGLYKLVLWVTFARFVRQAAAGAYSPTLLLLRVFSLGPRSLRLFDALSKHWLRAGPIALVAGPDLVTGIVEPPEFLDFLGGRVSRRFVQGRDDLEQRLAQLDTLPDPDGRYRVNEFFCRADTWQMTMRQLAARSDTVLMDLRSFSPSNQGCLYELGQLLNGVSLPQVLLIVDATTDLAFLKSTLQDLWRLVPADSPNRSLQDPEVRLYEVKSGTGAEVRTLLSLLSAQLRSSAGFGPAGKAT